MSIAANALQPGALLGELKIERVLGTGASGITYLVSDTALDTILVVKEYFPAAYATRLDNGRVSPAEDSQGDYARGLEGFLEEGRMAAAIDHPGIVRVSRYFEINGTACLVMPWHGGQTLAEWLASQGNLDRSQVHRLVLPLLDAVEYLHGKALFHLDIKPANILVTESGDPLLLDFGAAAAAETYRGMGSKGYAAPEQSDTEAGIGPWSDFYGLAATLYRCISGEVPVPAQQRNAAIEAGRPDPLPPLASLPGANEFGGLIDFIDHGLELETRARPQSAAAWRKTYQSLDWRRMVAGKESSEYEAEGREWLPMILLAAFLLTMGAVLVYILSGQSPDFPAGSDQSTPVTGPAGQDTWMPPGKDRVKPPPVSDEEKLRWQAALQADTLLGYRRFVEDFPGSVYLEQAQLQIDLLDEQAWQALSAENTRQAFTDYLDQFATGKHQAEALQRIDEIDQALAREEREKLEQERLDEAAWLAASKARTVAALDRYISAWPAGNHLEEAGELRRELLDEANDAKAFELAGRLSTRDAYQAYIDAFPRGARVTEALQMIDGLTFRPGKLFRDCPLCPQMIVIGGGSFQQGSEADSALAMGNEQPRRTVTITQQLAVAVHEVTMEQWDACVDEGACSNRPEDNGWGRDSRPVIMVSWNDTQQYIQWLRQMTGQAYRLPSESEWEYFARAGEESDWIGGDPAGLCDYANVAGKETGFRWQHEFCADNYALGTLPVGSLRANAFGLHDVIGNVAEWTDDCMNLSYLDAPVDGSAWGRGICSSHMTRGGSWVTGSNEVRLPARFNLKNGDHNDFTGFRVVRELDD